MTRPASPEAEDGACLVMPAPLPTPERPPFRAQPWRRHRRRKWARLAGRPLPDVMLSTIPSLPRAVLARLVETMIDRMDEIDGDPDLEDRYDLEAVYDI